MTIDSYFYPETHNTLVIKMNEKRFYVCRCTYIPAAKNLPVMNQVLIGGPYTEYDANSFALYYTKGRRAEEIYIVLEMVEPNGQ